LLLGLGPPTTVSAQTGARLGTAGTRINTIDGVRLSGPRLGIPITRTQGFGVRSQAPRPIGRFDVPGLPGTGLHRRPGLSIDRSTADAYRPVPGGSGLIRGGDGTWRPAPWGNDDRIRIGTGGVNASITARGDKWRFAAALNSAPDFAWLHCRRPNWGCVGWNSWNRCNVYDGLIGGWYAGWYPSTFAVDYSGVDPFVTYGNPPPPQQPAIDPEDGMTAPQKAARRLRMGKPDEAIVLLRPHVDANPSDEHAARSLAVALLDARRTREGVAVMALTYERHPGLARVPIDADAVGPVREMRDLVVRVVQFGHTTNTASAWLTAAVLMQAENRPEPALRMLDRADGLGLDSSLSKSMRVALRP
jgi:hypothetical protein